MIFSCIGRFYNISNINSPPLSPSLEKRGGFFVGGILLTVQELFVEDSFAFHIILKLISNSDGFPEAGQATNPQKTGRDCSTIMLF